MEGVEFEEEKNYIRPYVQPPKKISWVIALTMKLGGKFIKTEEQATKILVIIVVVFFLLSIYNFFF